MNFGLLDDKVALITGAGRGIGAAIAKGFAAHGASVVLVSRTLSQVKAQAMGIKDEYGVAAIGVECDVSDEQQVEKMVEQTVSEMGRIDVLVNCAGITMVSPSEELSLENWQHCLDINLNGTFLCCKHVGKQMIAQGHGGKMINITSIVAHAAIPERAAYAASKGGVMQLTQNLAVEWAPHNIQVNAISPGFIRTEIVQDLIEKGIHKPAKLEVRIPAGRMGETEDMAGPAIFFASALSNYVTGTILKADGGWLANGYL